MIKRLLIIAMVCCVNIVLQAQLAVGQWQLFPTKSSEAGIIYESIHDEVYYLSGNNLFSYDKSTSEIETYNSGNYLSDNEIKNIYYNYDKGYLMVVYSNSNIDLIYTHKKVVNIPDLKNTIMMYSKSINDVVFFNNKIYLATDFGLVVLNDDKHEVYESYIYEKVFSKLVVVDDYLLALIDNQLYISLLQPGLYDFNEHWSAIDMNGIVPTTVSNMYVINDKQVLFSCNETSYILNVENSTFTEQTTSYYYAKFMNRTKTGHLISFSGNIRFISSEVSEDNQLIVSQIYSTDKAGIKDGYYSSYNSANTIWCCNADGISHFKYSGSTLEFLVQPSSFNTSSVQDPRSITICNDKVYVKNMGPYNHSVDMSKATIVSQYDLNTYEWSVMSLDNVIRDGNASSKGALRSSFNMAFDPDSSEIFYVGSWFDGLHKFNGTKYVGNYNQHNSPLAHPWEMLDSFTDFDADGNLWTIMVSNSLGTNSLLACLPADKKTKDPAVSTANDWITYDIGANLSYFNNLLVCKRSPYVFAIHCKSMNPTRLTVLNRKTGQSRIFSTFTDQDGGSFGNGVIFFFTATEDKNGNVWLGTSSGPIILGNLSNIMNSDYRCTRIKVPRNDGTNYADYLLEDESINDIVVDGANRKWLATSSSGLYLVSENGTEIIDNQNTSNSIIPSDMIYDMVMNDATGEIFVITDRGVASYRSDVSEVAPDYNNVVVYPNPVRPDYTGWITIQGLMDNSLVKITDVAGNLFNEGYANGGTYLWDGRTASGERVKTGVYLIYASQSGGSSGVVAKVMVVN